MVSQQKYDPNYTGQIIFSGYFKKKKNNGTLTAISSKYVMRYVILNLEKYEIEYKTDQSTSEATKVYNLKDLYCVYGYDRTDTFEHPPIYYYSLLFDFPGDRLQIYTDNESKYTQMKQALGACYTFKKEPLHKFIYPVKKKTSGSPTNSPFNSLKESNTVPNLISDSNSSKNSISINNNQQNTQKIIELNKAMALKNLKTIENQSHTLNPKKEILKEKLDEIKEGKESQLNETKNIKATNIQQSNEIEDISNNEKNQSVLESLKKVKPIENYQAKEHEKKSEDSIQRKEFPIEKDINININNNFEKISKEVKLSSQRTTTSLPKCIKFDNINILPVENNSQNPTTNNETIKKQKRVHLKFSATGMTEMVSTKEESKKEKTEISLNKKINTLKRLENTSSTLNLNPSAIDKMKTKVNTLELLKKNAREAWNVEDLHIKNNVNMVKEAHTIEDPKFNIVTENYARNPSDEIDEWD